MTRRPSLTAVSDFPDLAVFGKVSGVRRCEMRGSDSDVEKIADARQLVRQDSGQMAHITGPQPASYPDARTNWRAPTRIACLVSRIRG